MKKLLFLVLLFWGSYHANASNLYIEYINGQTATEALEVIGRLEFQSEKMLLIAHNGIVLGEISVDKIKKLVFETPNSLDKIDINMLYVYPNPTHDMLMVHGVDENTLLRVFDMSGRLVASEVGNRISVADLAIGTYLLQVNTNVVKFIKQ